jgi:hypothetical protein
MSLEWNKSTAPYYNDYQGLVFPQGEITLEPRPPYCDRGNFIAKIFPQPGSELARDLDDQDGWPRYYFDEARAKAEIEAWLKKRGLDK